MTAMAVSLSVGNQVLALPESAKKDNPTGLFGERVTQPADE